MTAYYIAEIDLPSKTAYAQHVLKMCDALAKFHKTELIIFSKKKNYNLVKLKKDYLIRNNFKIIFFSKEPQKKNLIYRIKFASFVKKSIKYNQLIISRSIITSILIAYYKYKNFLELHHSLTGFTKYIFKFRNLFLNNRYIKFILIHKNLSKYLGIKKDYLILDDAVDLNNFKIKSKKKELYDCTYMGSLFEGKGIEVVIYLAKFFQNINFYIFGDIKKINLNFLKEIKQLRLKNLHFKGFVKYSKVPKILLSSKILIMPYLSKVMVNSNELEVSNVMSPLKMFEYLASGKIILASNLKVYRHILKNNFNCIMADPNNFSEWKKKFSLIIKKKINAKKISKNALDTAKNFTWENRVKRINSKHLSNRKS